ncbi:MAG: Fe-S cluster assembly protein SufD [Bdellovibrionales bacterium]|nr:Fe-S cluster assembly protein SufD [Bdellovibrionales bacterium]
MAEAKEIEWVVSEFEGFERSLNGEKSSDFHGMRRDAYERFAVLGLPAATDEEWRYTNLKSLAKGDFTVGSSKSVPKIPAEVLEQKVVPGINNRFVFINGIYSATLSQALQGESVRVKNIRNVLKDSSDVDHELVKEHFAQVARYQEEAFVALNTAFVQDGACVVIPKDTSVEEPIQLVFVTATGEHAVATQPRVLIIAEPGSKASIVELYCQIGDEANVPTSFTAAVSEVVVMDNARLDQYRLVQEGPGTSHVSVVHAKQGAHSHFATYAFSLGGALTRNNVSCLLDGEHGFAGLFGLTLLAGNQHVDNHTVLDHAVPHCQSKEVYKGIYGDNAKGIFNGTIIVRPGAQKTNAIQSNQSILLSDSASSYSKPQLKIWADDVRCTHGATVGQLDEDALFYLRSRGIRQEEARHMLLQAFYGEVLSEIQNEHVRHYVERCALATLAQANSCTSDTSEE